MTNPNHPQKIQNILNLPAQERYEYFIQKVADFEEVWLLKHEDGWALAGTSEEMFFPVWPEQSFALLCAEDTWQDYHPVAMTLEEFLTGLSPHLRENNIAFSVFLTPAHKGIIVSPDDLIADIEEECEPYE